MSGGQRGDKVIIAEGLRYFEGHFRPFELEQKIKTLCDNGSIDKYFLRVIECYMNHLFNRAEMASKLRALDPADLIRVLTSMLGMKQREFSKLSGMRWVRTPRQPKYDEAIRLSAILECSWTAFLGAVHRETDPWYVDCGRFNEDSKLSFSYGQWACDGVWVGAVLQRSVVGTMLSITVSGPPPNSLNSWFVALDHLRQRMHLIEPHMYMVTYPFLDIGSSQIHTIAWPNFSDNRGRLGLYLRVFSTRTVRVSIGRTVYDCPVEERQLIIDALKNAYMIK